MGKRVGIRITAFMGLFLLLASGTLPFSQSFGAELKDPVKLTFASQPLGGSWYVYASTIAQMLRKVLPKDSLIDVIPQSGGIGNPLMISQGKADLGISNSVTNKWSGEGVYFFEGKAVKNVRGLVGGLDIVYGVMILREEFIKRTGLDSLEKIIAKKHPVRFICKPPGSITPVYAEIILSAYGVKFADFKAWGGSSTFTTSEAITMAIRDGRADLTIDLVPSKQPAVSELAITANVRFLPLSDKERAKLNELGFENIVMPANQFKGQENPLQTITPGVTIICSENMSEDLAYIITKTICDGQKELAKTFASLNNFDPTVAWKPDKVGLPLHPGAVKYYKEKGWMK
jgi:TRAP transporter TAXI family solute receptor